MLKKKAVKVTIEFYCMSLLAIAGAVDKPNNMTSRPCGWLIGGTRAVCELRMAAYVTPSHLTPPATTRFGVLSPVRCATRCRDCTHQSNGNSINTTWDHFVTHSLSNGVFEHVSF